MAEHGIQSLNNGTLNAIKNDPEHQYFTLFKAYNHTVRQLYFLRKLMQLFWNRNKEFQKIYHETELQDITNKNNIEFSFISTQPSWSGDVEIELKLIHLVKEFENFLEKHNVDYENIALENSEYDIRKQEKSAFKMNGYITVSLFSQRSLYIAPIIFYKNNTGGKLSYGLLYGRLQIKTNKLLSTDYVAIHGDLLEDIK